MTGAEEKKRIRWTAGLLGVGIKSESNQKKTSRKCLTSTCWEGSIVGGDETFHLHCHGRGWSCYL
jgi:hypothetical protein